MSARRVLMLLGVSALAVAGGMSVAQRRAPRGLVDWELARRLARKLSAAPEPWSPDVELTASYDVIVARSLRAVADYIGSGPQLDSQRVRVLDRRDWIDANLASFRELLGPLIQAYDGAHAASRGPARLIGVATHYGVSGQLGVLLGVLSRHVLGQYDIPLLDPTPDAAAIYFVDPNIRAIAAQSRVDVGDLRMWVALHESTHAYQFHAVDPPWLRDYIGGLMRDYLAAAVKTLGQSRQLRVRLRIRLRRWQRGELRDVGLLGLALTSEQAATLRRIQALMTLMEGHSNHVMRAAGEQVIPAYAQLAARMRVREQSRGAAFRVLVRLLGLDLKLQQYRIGEAFVNHVVRERDLAFVNRAWVNAARLPTLDETRDPAAWITRMERDDEP